MSLQIKIVLISFIISIITALIVLPILKKLKVGQIEREYGPRSHLIKQGTPTMGGIIIAITLIVATILLYNSNKELIPLALMCIGFGVVGFVDDFKKLVLKDTEGLKPTYKILGLLIVSVMYALYLIKSGIGTRNYNSRAKDRNCIASFNLHTICDFSNACWNKCCKFN